VKFDLFLEEALSLGFDGIATGHYARCEATPPHEKGELEGVSQKRIPHNVTPPILPFSGEG
jgi:tRNA U34 2-thiouridine synthase MnmA/TrmU